MHHYINYINNTFLTVGETKQKQMDKKTSKQLSFGYGSRSAVDPGR